MTLGERVRDRMNALGLSQAELARRVGVSQPSIYALIHRNKSGTRNLHLIARELKTTPAYLTGETEDPEQGPPPPGYDTTEQQLVAAFRRLSAEHRLAVATIINGLLVGGQSPTGKRN